jgi:hypothetical protein
MNVGINWESVATGLDYQSGNGGGPPGSRAERVTFLLIAATTGGALLLYLFVRDRADTRASLDERQRQLRDRAMVLSYQLLSAVVVLAVAIVAVAVLGVGRTVTLDGAAVGGVAITVGVLIPLLPTAALAWIEPDAPAEV